MEWQRTGGLYIIRVAFRATSSGDVTTNDTGGISWQYQGFKQRFFLQRLLGAPDFPKTFKQEIFETGGSWGEGEGRKNHLSLAK